MNKLLFFIKRPPLVFIVGKGSSLAAKTISQILDKDILIFESVLSEFFLKKSRMPILVVTQIEEKKDVSQIRSLAKNLPEQGYLILNFDDDRTRELRSLAHCLTFGFSKKADVQATDFNISPEGANFKINYQGNIVPFWLKNVSQKKELYSILAAISVAIARNINLVEISQSLK